MTSLDKLYAPDFPHGSVDGFNAGCTTRPLCTNHNSPEMLTCVEAKQQWNGDYNIRKLPTSQPLRRELPAPTAKPAPRPPLSVEPITPEAEAAIDLVTNTAITPAAAAAIDQVTSIPPESRKRGPYLPKDLAFDDPRYPHGTDKGYKRGCRNDETCPGNDAGTSCTTAHRATFKRPPAEPTPEPSDGVVSPSTDEPHADAPTERDDTPPENTTTHTSSGAETDVDEGDASKHAGREDLGTVTAPAPLEPAKPEEPSKPELGTAAYWNNIDQEIVIAPVDTTTAIDELTETLSSDPSPAAPLTTAGDPARNISETVARADLQLIKQLQDELALSEEANRQQATDNLRLQQNLEDLEHALTLADSVKVKAAAPAVDNPIDWTAALANLTPIQGPMRPASSVNTRIDVSLPQLPSGQSTTLQIAIPGIGHIAVTVDAN